MVLWKKLKQKRDQDKDNDRKIVLSNVEECNRGCHSYAFRGKADILIRNGKSEARGKKW